MTSKSPSLARPLSPAPPATLRVVVSGGGTGGHIYPALAVVQALQSDKSEAETATADGGRRTAGALSGGTGPETQSSVLSPQSSAAEILYLHGPARIDEEVMAHAGVPHRRLSAGPIRGAAPHRLALNTLRLVRAAGEAWAALRSFRAQVVLATGGYVSAPTMLAAALSRVPVVLYLPDASPGLAVRAFAPLAKRIALSFPTAQTYFPARKTVVTGYPVRPEFLHADREAARKQFDLSPGLPVVMVMGGSTGAHSINVALSEGLEPLLHHAQVIHLCGELDEAALRAQRAQLEPVLRQRYHLFRYLHRGVADAMAASNLVVCRAGASVLAELPVLHLPAILIPHPFGHQDENADFLVEQGGATKIEDRELSAGALLPATLGLLADPAKLAAMAARMADLARPDAAENIAALVRSVANRPRGSYS